MLFLYLCLFTRCNRLWRTNSTNFGKNKKCISKICYASIFETSFNLYKEKYKIHDAYEVVLLSSQKAVEVVSNKYFIHNKIDINEPFGVILVQNGTTQIKKVLKFIQHVGYNLSSRLAEDYLFEVGILKQKHQEELEDKTLAKEILISNLAIAYNQPTKIFL